MKKRAIIYLGVPQDMQSRALRQRVSKQSIDRQFERCLNKIISIGALFVTFYADFGEPTVEPDRTGMAAMLRDLRMPKCEIDLLVVEDETCLSTEAIAQSAVTETLKKSNIELLVVDRSGGRRAA